MRPIKWGKTAAAMGGMAAAFYAGAGVALVMLVIVVLMPAER